MSTLETQSTFRGGIEVPKDPIAESLRTYAEYLLVIVFGLLPILFIPSGVAPFEYTKIFIAGTAVLAAMIFYSLAALRGGGISVGFSPVVLSVWGIAGVALLSALFSGDFSDAFVGDILTTHTTAFLALLALIVSAWTLIAPQKPAVMRLYMLLAASTVILVVYHSVRMFLGPEVLSFGVFTGTMSTPVGSWNDLALFLGLSVILSLISLDHLPLTKHGKGLFVVVVLLALFMLGVINFFTVWIVLGCASLAFVVYALSKDRLPQNQPSLVPQRSVNMVSLVVSLIVFLTSAVFVIGGSALGGAISGYTGMSYVEVRPSLEATADVARQVYGEQALLGVGPNKFTDAWRLYKDSSINGTVFWNTDFLAGSGYVPTFFVTTGVLGGLAWIVFIGFFLWSGLRMVFDGSERDRLWYFVGVSSFVAGLYIWGMSLVYVPGAVMLLIAALCTGVMIVAEKALRREEPRTFTFTTNRRTGFVFTLAVVVVIIGSVTVLYGAGKHYASVYTYSEAVSALGGGDTDAYLRGLNTAYTLYPSDVYLRRQAELELSRINELLALPSPTDTERVAFEQSIVNGINLADRARQEDRLEADNWTVLGTMYSALMGANIDGVYDKAKESLDEATRLHPTNPLAHLNQAVLEGRAGKNDTARTYALESVNLKPNFIDGYYYLSQLDILTGNVEGAVQSTLSTIMLDPNNPARHYQLGVLEISRKNYDAAITAFERAVTLDENFSNARYFLARAYGEMNRESDALRELERVLQLNPGNEVVMSLIQTLQAGGSIREATPQGLLTESAPLVEEGGAMGQDGAVVTEGDPETDLVSPINTVPENTETPREE